MIHVCIIDDHPLVRHGLRKLCEETSGIRVAGEAGTLEAAEEQLIQLHPQVALIDLNLGRNSALPLIKICRAQNPPIAAVILTMDEQPSSFDEALSHGASGYVLKENAIAEVLLAIQTAASGGLFLSSSLRDMVGKRQDPTRMRSRDHRLAALTPTERRVFRLVGSNRTSKEIAQELCISPRTVETHRANICDRLNLRGAQVLLRFALENRDAV
jgi:DNA-binding NarL/FixJ family response regulator